MTQCEQKRHNGDSFEEEPTMRNMKVREDGSDSDGASRTLAVSCAAVLRCEISRPG